MLSWQGMPEELKDNYGVVRTLKKTDSKEIVVLAHYANKEQRLLCNYSGVVLPIYNCLEGKQFAHLPQVLALYPREGGYSVLIQFVEGVSLAEVVEKQPMQPKEALEVMTQLCDALHHLHELGIVHRDVKPENILRTQDGTVYLIDYDAARLYKAYAHNDTYVIGTTGYAALEQFGIVQTDQRADIFALGITLNVLLTGRHPSQRVYKGYLSRAIMRSTRIDPTKRYRTVEEFYRAIQPYYRLLCLTGGRIPRISPTVSLVCTGALCVALCCGVLWGNRASLFALPEQESASWGEQVDSVQSAANLAASLHGALANGDADTQKQLSETASSQKSSSSRTQTSSSGGSIPTPAEATVPTTSSSSSSSNPSSSNPSSSSKPASSSEVDITQKPGYNYILDAINIYRESKAEYERCRPLYLAAKAHNDANYRAPLADLAAQKASLQAEANQANAALATAQETLRAAQQANPQDPDAIAAAQAAVDAAQRTADEKNMAVEQLQGKVYALSEQWMEDPMQWQEEENKEWGENGAVWVQADYQNIIDMQNKYGIYIFSE